MAAVDDLALLELSCGALGIGDPWWSFEGLAIELELDEGAYRIRRAVARAAGNGGSVHYENAALAALSAEAAQAIRWELVSPACFIGKNGGFWTEVGAIGYGTPPALFPRPVVHNGAHDDLRPPLDAAWHELRNEADHLIICSVGPQHQEILTWKALDETGRVVAVMSDLGLLDLDPTVEPLPWFLSGLQHGC